MRLSQGFAAEQEAEGNATDWERFYGEDDPLHAYHTNVEVKTLEDGSSLKLFSYQDHDSGSDSLFCALSLGDHKAFVSFECSTNYEMIAVERHIEGYEDMRLEGADARSAFEQLVQNMGSKLFADEFEQHFINAFNDSWKITSDRSVAPA